MIIQHNYSSTYFLNSIPTLYHLLKIINVSNIGMEIAFIGYSNSGKSSIINALTKQKNLTKVGKNPGSTKFINLFEVSPRIHLVDFPGYGYSNDINKKKYYWYNMINQYIKRRKNLKGIVLITDIRRYIIKKLDQKIIKVALQYNVPILILLNKSDKISKSMAFKIFQSIKQSLYFVNNVHSQPQFKIFSSIRSNNFYKIKSLEDILNNWLI